MKPTTRNQCRNMTGEAIRKGQLVRRPCEKCGAAKAQAHHEDYSNPLKVVWLCLACHRARHKELRRAGIIISDGMPQGGRVVRTTISLPYSLYKEAERMAVADGRTFSNYIAVLIRRDAADQLEAAA